jgi:hypothetical protein
MHQGSRFRRDDLGVSQPSQEGVVRCRWLVLPVVRTPEKPRILEPQRDCARWRAPYPQQFLAVERLCPYPALVFPVS